MIWAVYGRANAVVNQLLEATVGWRDVTQSRRICLDGIAGAAGQTFARWLADLTHGRREMGTRKP